MPVATSFLCVFLALFVSFVATDSEPSKGHLTVFCFLNGDLEPHTGNGSFEDCIPAGARCRAPTGELSQAINEINCTVPSYEKLNCYFKWFRRGDTCPKGRRHCFGIHVHCGYDVPDDGAEIDESGGNARETEDVALAVHKHGSSAKEAVHEAVDDERGELQREFDSEIASLTDQELSQLEADGNTLQPDALRTTTQYEQAAQESHGPTEGVSSSSPSLEDAADETVDESFVVPDIPSEQQPHQSSSRFPHMRLSWAMIIVLVAVFIGLAVAGIAFFTVHAQWRSNSANLASREKKFVSSVYTISSDSTV